MKHIFLALAMTIASVGAFAAERPTADIVDTAIAAGKFNTLVAAVQAAGLESTLRGEGPFTVFAPTDEAFAKLPAGTVDALLKDPKALANILTYHVAAGAIGSAHLEDMDSVETVQGGELEVSACSESGLYINGAKVLIKDIMTKNGVIHVIDTVLIPE